MAYSPPNAASVAAAPKADLLKRFLAHLVDAIIASAAGTFVGILAPALGGIASGGYFLVRDGLDLEFMDQRSIGKRLLNLRPLRLDGQPMDVEASMRRNWMFAIGGAVQASYGLGVLASLLSFVGAVIVIYEIYRVVTDSAGRRWGDDLANTKVVETGSFAGSSPL